MFSIFADLRAYWQIKGKDSSSRFFDLQTRRLSVQKIIKDKFRIKVDMEGQLQPAKQPAKFQFKETN